MKGRDLDISAFKVVAARLPCWAGAKAAAEAIKEAMMAVFMVIWIGDGASNG